MWNACQEVKNQQGEKGFDLKKTTHPFCDGSLSVRLNYTKATAQWFPFQFNSFDQREAENWLFHERKLKQNMFQSLSKADLLF